MLDMGVLKRQQRPLGGPSAVIQVLEAVDAAASTGSQREKEKAWIKERLARKRSVAERELQQKQELPQQRRPAQQLSPAPKVRIVSRAFLCRLLVAGEFVL